MVQEIKLLIAFHNCIKNMIYFFFHCNSELVCKLPKIVLACTCCLKIIWQVQIWCNLSCTRLGHQKVIFYLNNGIMAASFPSSDGIPSFKNFRGLKRDGKIWWKTVVKRHILNQKIVKKLGIFVKLLRKNWEFLQRITEMWILAKGLWLYWTCTYVFPWDGEIQNIFSPCQISNLHQRVGSYYFSSWLKSIVFYVLFLHQHF